MVRIKEIDVEQYVIRQIKRKSTQKKKKVVLKERKRWQLFLYMKNKIVQLKTGITSLIFKFKQAVREFAHNESTQEIWAVVKWMIGYGLIIAPGVYLIFHTKMNVIVVILGCGGLHYLFHDIVNLIVEKIKEVMNK